jgi:hypothetical protein
MLTSRYAREEKARRRSMQRTASQVRRGLVEQQRPRVDAV